MNNSVSDSPLGQSTQYVSVYSPELLFPVARQMSRQTLGISGSDLPFYGVDVWTGYEISWLDERGKPVVAMAEFHIPCSSNFIIESKSFKLYLNSFNQTSFSNIDQVHAILLKDLSEAAGTMISLSVTPLMAITHNLNMLDGICLDGLPVAIDDYHPAPELLVVNQGGAVEEKLVSHLLKSNCPVTGQPDWASVQIDYAGAQISHEGLLRYIISFREHQDFHEHCVERMFMDIMQRCQPQRLSIYARYTRRGGLDINPFRTTESDFTLKPVRLVRQ